MSCKGGQATGCSGATLVLLSMERPLETLVFCALNGEKEGFLFVFRQNATSRNKQEKSFVSFSAFLRQSPCPSQLQEQTQGWSQVRRSEAAAPAEQRVPGLPEAPRGASAPR